MDCVSFDPSLANRLQPVRVAGQAFTIPNGFGASPRQWLALSRSERIAHIRPFYARDLSRETQAQYDARLGLLETQITTRAFMSVPKTRPAGAGTLPFSGENLFGSSSGKDTSDGGGSGTGTPPSNTQVVAGTAASILGVAASTIQAAITSGNETERARIDAEARTKIEEIRAAQHASDDPAQQSASQAMIDSLNSLREQLGTKMSTGTIIAIVAGGIILLAGGVYVFMNRAPRHNPVIEDAYGNRRFVSAWRLAPR